jgi:hypothetical protein
MDLSSTAAGGVSASAIAGASEVKEVEGNNVGMKRAKRKERVELKESRVKEVTARKTEEGGE